mgnify:CR=1 FL=1
MLDTTLSAPQTMRYAAILECFKEANTEGARPCRVLHRNGVLEAWTWLSGLPDRTPMTGKVTTMEIQCVDTEFLVLDFEPLPDLPLTSALDEQCCPIPGLVQQVSDLVESLLKRHSGHKDSGHLIPGHGGILDRVDSILAALPVFVLGKLWLGI